jgi:hypothetical protein
MIPPFDDAGDLPPGLHTATWTVLGFVALSNRTVDFSFVDNWSNWWTMHEQVVS